MLLLYQDPHFTFRFEEDRLIPRFHLEGIEAGQSVSIFRLERETGHRQERMISVTVGDAGWVDLPEPIVVRAGEGFIVVPEAKP